MKNVILKRLSLVNWKGQKERSIDFSNEQAFVVQMQPEINNV